MDSVKIKDRRLLRLGIALTVLLIVFKALPYGADIIFNTYAPAVLEHPLYIWLTSTVPLYAVGLPLCLILLPKKDKNEFETGEFGVSHFFIAAVVCFGLSLVGSLVGNGLMLIASLIKGEPIVNPINEAIMGSNVFYTFFFTVIVAPIGEEFICRRLIIDRTRRFGDIPAILLSAAVFAGLHMNFYQFFYALLIGVVLAYVYIRTGKLRYSIFLHMIINLVGGVYVQQLYKIMMELIGDGTEIDFSMMLPTVIVMMLIYGYIWMLFSSSVITVILATVFLPKMKFTPGEGVRSILRSPFIIVFFVLCLIFTVVGIII